MRLRIWVAVRAVSGVGVGMRMWIQVSTGLTRFKGFDDEFTHNSGAAGASFLDGATFAMELATFVSRLWLAPGADRDCSC
jgi:hypothetical protein